MSMAARRTSLGRALAGALLVAGGCGAVQVKPSDATLVVACADADAQVYVDEGYAGLAIETRATPLGLGAGFHRVEVRAVGRLSSYRGVTLVRGDRRTLAVQLRPDLDEAEAATGGGAP